ncbi:hypothetical protein C5167_002884 [Papaver somniferum]|uniref:Uncharacterized protein n=1 Tax=Papaver somniferum TaxID=3469 RepID=A0A4Y7KZH4_PAPSO|nr:hypothetical protein C5167_002884 [Papaver somniferum]
MISIVGYTKMGPEMIWVWFCVAAGIELRRNGSTTELLMEVDVDVVAARNAVEAAEIVDWAVGMCSGSESEDMELMVSGGGNGPETEPMVQLRLRAGNAVLSRAEGTGGAQKDKLLPMARTWNWTK